MAALLLFLQPGHSDSPQKIVSLDLCSDWMLLKYAGGSRELFLSPLFRRYRANSLQLPQDLPSHDGSLEHILSLRPDLVISGEYNAPVLRQRLSQLGIKVVVFALPGSLQSIVDYQQQFKSALGLADSENIPQLPAAHARKKQSLLLLGPNAIGTGQQTLEHEILSRAGWDNYVEQAGYVNLALEQVVADPPDAILWSAQPSASLAGQFARHPLLQRLLARSGRGHTDYWRWQCPGPWSFDLVEELAAW